MSSRRIVATIGPASENEVVLRQILPYIAYARMNMSHGSYEEHTAKIEKIRAIDTDVKILVDLQGPKIRVGKFPGGPVQYAKGDKAHLIFDLSKIEMCDKDNLYVSIPHLITDCKAGDILLFNDGYLAAKVLAKTSPTTLEIEMLNQGTLSSKKGINSSTASLSVNPLTEKDIADLEFGVKMNADVIALSFVRNAEDVKDLRARINALGSKAQLCVKIERHEAMVNLDAIVQESDVVMIARGDLGVETDITDLPVNQEKILASAKKFGKPCIWATQVLESMITVPRPTRAEVTDLYAAIKLGSDYTMLSAESAGGQFPVESVEFMASMWKKYSK